MPPMAPKATWRADATLRCVSSLALRRGGGTGWEDSRSGALAADVVRLPCQDGGQVSVAAREAEEDAAVADVVVGVVGGHEEAGEADGAGEEDGGDARLGLVGVPGDDVRVGDGGEGGGRGQQEHVLGRVAHAAQDHGGEVGEGVDADGSRHEEEGAVRG